MNESYSPKLVAELAATILSGVYANTECINGYVMTLTDAIIQAKELIKLANEGT